jgi:glycosyltransferase involved in cell wall biosynthesis
VQIVFVVPTSPRVIGGITSNYYLANHLTRRGHHVTIVHIDMLGYDVTDTDAIPWFTFDEQVEHLFLPTADPTGLSPRVDYAAISDADFIFVMNVDDGIPPARNGLPLVTVRGFGIYGKATDEGAFRAPFPKVVPARWLIGVGRDMGVSEQEFVLVPNGIDHDKYRVTRPIEDRPPHVSMVYRSHRTKGAKFGLQALTRLKRNQPDVTATLFGNKAPEHEIAPWITYRQDPPQREIVDDIYNGSAVFLAPSVVEGFGKPPIEAMACGCALVTTDNGGSADYAIDGETALVCPPKDGRALADAIASLLRDDELRRSIAKSGREYVTRFDWDNSAATLERFLLDYGAEPGRWRR